MKIDVEVNVTKIQTKFADLNDNEEVKTLVHNAFAKELNPYVPMQTGILAQTTMITAEGVTYVQPYAHYQYTGLVYGPNIPITENGVITGWFSQPGKGSKHPTGESLTYSTELHPLATHHWDRAMMRDRGKEFTKEVERIIKWWLKRNR